MQINIGRNKSRQERLKQAKRRFQFDPNKLPKHNQQLHKSIVKHRTSSVMTTSQLPSSIECVDVDSHIQQQKQSNLKNKPINDEKMLKNQLLTIKTNTQCSSVNPTNNQKFEQLFENQSSWLANLVEGIQDLYHKPGNSKIIEISERQYQGNFNQNSNNEKSSSLASSKYCFSKKKHNVIQGSKQSSKSATKDPRISQHYKCQKDRGYENRNKSKTIYSKNSQSFQTSKRPSFNLNNQPIIKRTKSKPDMQVSYKEKLKNEKGKTQQVQEYSDNRYKCPNQTPNITNQKSMSNTPTKRSVSSLNLNRKQSAPGIISNQKYDKNSQFKYDDFEVIKRQQKQHQKPKKHIIYEKVEQKCQKLPDLAKQQIKITNQFKARIRKNSVLMDQKQALTIKEDRSQNLRNRQCIIGGIRRNANSRQLKFGSVSEVLNQKSSNTQNILVLQTFSTEVDNSETVNRVTSRFNEKGRIRNNKIEQKKINYKSQQSSSQKRFKHQINLTKSNQQYKQNQQIFINNARLYQQNQKMQQTKLTQKHRLLECKYQPKYIDIENKQDAQPFSIPKQKIIDIFYKLNPNNQKYLTSELIKKNQSKLFFNKQNKNNKERIMQSIIRSIFIELRISKINFTLEQFVQFMGKISNKFTKKSDNNASNAVFKFSQNNQRLKFSDQKIHLNCKMPSNSRNIDSFRLIDQKQQKNQISLKNRYNLQLQESHKKYLSQNTFGRSELKQIQCKISNQNTFNLANQAKSFQTDQTKIKGLQMADYKQLEKQPIQLEQYRNVSERQSIEGRLNRIHKKYTSKISSCQLDKPVEQNQILAYNQLKKSMPIPKQQFSHNQPQYVSKYQTFRSNASFTRFQTQRLQAMKSKNRELHQKLVTFNNVTNSSILSSQSSRQLIPDRNNYIQQVSDSSDDQQKVQEGNKSFIFPVIVQEDEQERQVPVKQPYLLMNSTAVLEIDQQKILKSMGLLQQYYSQKQRKSLSNSQAIQLIQKISQHPQMQQISNNCLQKPISKQLQKYRYGYSRHNEWNRVEVYKQIAESEPWTARNISQNSWRNNMMRNTMGCDQNNNLINRVNEQLNQNTYSIIEKLNRKLSNYIETNCLNQTQKFLKFNFSQLKKNLKA